MKSVAVVGVGLIGGSFALALRQSGFSGGIVGVSSPPTIEAAVTAGAIDHGVSIEEAARTADLIYLAQPVELILDTLNILGPLYQNGCLVTDAGSTKLEIVNRAAQTLPPGAFLGGHPMAGKEARGVHAADSRLFEGRPYVLTPSAPTRTECESEFRSYLTKMGAQMIDMPADVHDSTVAYTSHLPQLVSTALAATLADASNSYTDQVFGTGLLDMTRLALSSPDLWLSILATNQREVISAIDRFSGELTRLRALLEQHEIKEIFHKGATFSAQLRKLPR